MTSKSGLGEEEAMKRAPQISGRLIMERLERFSTQERGVLCCFENYY